MTTAAACVSARFSTTSGLITSRSAIPCRQRESHRYRHFLKGYRSIDLTTLVATGAGGVGFNCGSNYWLDVAEFEERVNPIVDLQLGQITPEHVARLEEAVALCEGEILDGVYGDWALRERERLNRTLSQCLARAHGLSSAS